MDSIGVTFVGGSWRLQTGKDITKRDGFPSEHLQNAITEGRGSAGSMPPLLSHLARSSLAIVSLIGHTHCKVVATAMAAACSLAVSRAPAVSCSQEQRVSASRRAFRSSSTRHHGWLDRREIGSLVTERLAAASGPGAAAPSAARELAAGDCASRGGGGWLPLVKRQMQVQCRPALASQASGLFWGAQPALHARCQACRTTCPPHPLPCCRAAADPFAERSTYKDNLFDRAMIWYFSSVMSKQLGGEGGRPRRALLPIAHAAHARRFFLTRRLVERAGAPPTACCPCASALGPASQSTALRSGAGKRPARALSASSCAASCRQPVPPALQALPPRPHRLPAPQALPPRPHRLPTRSPSHSTAGAPFDGSWDGFVDLSREIMRGRNSKEQQETVAGVLAGLLPPQVGRAGAAYVALSGFQARSIASERAEACWELGVLLMLAAQSQRAACCQAGGGLTGAAHGSAVASGSCRKPRLLTHQPARLEPSSLRWAGARGR